MQTTLKITAKGQVTLRKALLDRLGVRPGDRVTIEVVAPGRAELRPAERKAGLEAFVGCLSDPGGPTLTIEEIDAIAREGWAGRR